MNWLLLSAVALALPPGSHGVVGGSTPVEGAWPQTAALLYGGGFLACSGVLIHPEWVLTAGHCAPNPSAVYLNTVDLEAPGEVHEIDDFRMYPDAFSSFDVALMHLVQPSAVEPAHLALDCISADWLRPGADVSIVGFGTTDSFGVVNATELQVADTQVVDPSCDATAAGCNAGAMPAGELIAGGDGVDSCTGDSGGPLFLWAAGEPWLVGTTARAAVPSDTPCGGGGIYVRADAIADWVEQTAGIALDRPSCDGLNRPPTITVADQRVAMNSHVWFEPELDDVNLGQQLTLSIRTEPEHGWAAIEGTEVVYVPSGTFVGTDTLELTVTDDGNPNEQTHATVGLTVVGGSPRERSGCAQTPGSSSWIWILLLFPLRRR